MTQNFSIAWLGTLGDARDSTARAKSLECFGASYEYFTRGYQIDVGKIIQGGLMPAGDARGQTIRVGPMPFYSLCEHHLLPFFGTAEITYTAGDYILGLGKFPQIVEALSTRLNLQENLTAAIADALHTYLKPQTVTVQLEARHLCLEMRGNASLTGTLLKTIKNR